MSIAELVGEEVLGKNGNVPTSSFSGSGKVVGLYFSAHWCPPCRGFTPALAEFHKKMKAKGKEFEIVFISSDRDQASFDGYYKEMPWLAIPFSDRERKGKLGEKYGVSGIPTLIILNGENGKIIVEDGRGKVMSDPEGNGFPWE